MGHCASRIAIKAGGGARRFADQVRALTERIGAAVVLSPGSTGVLPDVLGLVALNLRAAGEYACYCGYDVSDLTQRFENVPVDCRLHIVEGGDRFEVLER